MQFSNRAILPVLLASLAAAAPSQRLKAGEKRQYTELINAGAGLADTLIVKVFDYLDSASDNAAVISRQIQGKATDYACIDGEKKVAPTWLENQLRPMCSKMTAAEEGSLVSSKFPNAMMSQEFPARQDAADGAHEGDWVSISIAWSQVPNFNGEHVEMSTSLCEEIIQYGMDICEFGTPGRTQGFNVAHNREWAVNIDVTNIDDDAAEGAYGGN